MTNAIVRKYNTRDPFDIVREKNVIIIFTPLKAIRGFYQYFQRNHIIYIDENLSMHEKMFVCAHELGHMLLHKKANAVFMDTRTFFNTNKYELEANLFAAELLIPDDILLEYYYYTTEQISRLLGYDQALVALKIRHLNFT